jgi:hypothetical protein
MCVFVCLLIIHIYIHSHVRLRDVRVLFVFNASESDWAPSDPISFPVVCVRMNEWMSRCVCLEREMCVFVCLLIIHIYIHSHPRLSDVRVLFVFNASESDWTPSDPISLSVVCVRMNEWMNEWVDVCLEREMCVLIIHIYISTHVQGQAMWELCLFSMLLKVIERLLILSYSLLCV